MKKDYNTRYTNINSLMMILSNKASRIIEYLSNHKELKSHAAPISKDKLKEVGLKIIELEEDQKL
ncbi:MAG: hypothetical protein QXI65_02030 [Metallosphaera sp.]